MTPRRPYLIRAIYDWILDNDCTPFLLVDCRKEGVAVPGDHVQDGKIVLNVNPSAVQGLALGNELIRFQARFGGQPFEVVLPPAAVLAVYARENGEGMMFPPEDDGGEPPPEPDPDGGGSGGKPDLKVVK